MTDLTNIQYEALKQVLRRRYGLLLERVRDELEQTGDRSYIELAGRVTDPADESAADLIADIGAAIVDRHVQELRDIEAALRRMVDGGYGECSDCGIGIEFKRLQVYPTAKRCVRCQGQREKTHVHEPTPSL